MKRKLAICVAGALSVWVLGLIAGLAPVAVSQQETVTPTPTVTATPPTQVDGMTANQILEMISSVGVTPAHSYLPGECGNAYKIEPVIDEVLSHDINHDGQAELLVDIHCDHYATSGDDKLLVILRRESGHWLPMFAFHYIGTWSEITFTDFDQDGEEEIAVSGNDLGAGSHTDFTNWETTFLRCEKVSCQIVWQYEPANYIKQSPWTNTDPDTRGFIRTDWRLVKLDSQQVGILATEQSISWRHAPEAYSPYDSNPVNDIELDPVFQKLYVLHNGIFEFKQEWATEQGHNVTVQMPRQKWQERLQPQLSQGNANWYGFEFELHDANNLIDLVPLLSGLVKPTDWLGWYRKGVIGFAILERRYYREEDPNCELSIHTVSAETNQEIISPTIAFLPCNPSLTALQVRPLGGVSNLKEYLLISTVEAGHFGTPEDEEVTPYQHVLVYSWDGSMVRQVDDLKGQLYLSGIDGVTLQCDDLSPCRATVRDWNFITSYFPIPSNPIPSLPTYHTLVWDSTKEKFAPAK